MKTVESRTASGGTLIEYFDQDGRRIRAVHSAGKTYSGRLAEIESREARQAKKAKKA